MYSENLYEKNKVRERLKDIATLAAFTIAIAVISVLAMNLLAYPVTIFAVKYFKAFNFIFKYLVIIGISAFIVSMVAVTVFRLRRRGLTSGEIAVYLVRKPFYSITIFLFFLAVSAVIIALLYIMLSNNYYFIYKITT
jgi:hypothetical protein